MKTIGLRIILTYKCNFSCDFCYQKKYDKTIKIEILDSILERLKGIDNNVPKIYLDIEFDVLK